MALLLQEAERAVQIWGYEMNGGAKKAVLGTVCTLASAAILYTAKQTSKVEPLSVEVASVKEKVQSSIENQKDVKDDQRAWNQLFLGNQQELMRAHAESSRKIDEVLRKIEERP